MSNSAWKVPALFGNAAALPYSDKVLALSPIAYWKMAEPSGTTALDSSGNSRNGTYSNVTLGVTGIGDGKTAASFNGANSLNNVYSASLAGAFSGDEGSISAWCKVANAGVWSDGQTRYVCAFGADGGGTNVIGMYKMGGNFIFRRGAAGGEKLVSIVPASTDWMHVCLTWSKSADQVKAYLNGTQQDTTKTGLAAFGAGLDSQFVTIGDVMIYNVFVWSGTLAHVALFNRPLQAAEVSALSVPT